MPPWQISRRTLLKGTSAMAATLFAAPARAAAPEPTAVTPALVEAARKEGKVVWYAAMDLPVSERVARAFEAKYSGIKCGSSAPGRSGSSPASRRNTAATSRPPT